MSYNERGGRCYCGCGALAPIATEHIPSRGHVKGEPLRYVLGHHLRKSPVLTVEEDRGYVTPCAIWQGGTNNQGYGMRRDRDQRKVRLAHVMAWEDENGPVPDGLELDHLCCVPLCVRPDHLEPVTHAENMRRWRLTRVSAT